MIASPKPVIDCIKEAMNIANTGTASSHGKKSNKINQPRFDMVLNVPMYFVGRRRRSVDFA